MAEKTAKKKPKKAAKPAAGASVLGSLPATRPTRIGGERRASAPRASKAAAPQSTATTPKAAATRAKAAAPKATAAKAAAPKAAARKPAASKAAAPKATATKTATAKPKAAKRTTAPIPAAARPEPAPRVPPPDQDRRPGGPPRGAEIVTTAVQAAGELAQIGLTVGGQLLKRAAGRLPRP
jgi:hypothetical protein